MRGKGGNVVPLQCLTFLFVSAHSLLKKVKKKKTGMCIYVLLLQCLPFLFISRQ